MFRLSFSVILLVAVNLLPLGGVLFFGWSLFTILLLYWVENGIVGLFNVFRIGFAARSDGGGQPRFTSGGSLNVASLGKAGIIPFFIFHYGIFWIVHGVFVVVLFGLLGGSFGSPDPMSGFDGFDARGAALGAAAMLLSHGFSFFYNFIGGKEYLEASPMRQMFEPYPRVMALHVTVIAGGFLAARFGSPVAALAVLVVVKISIDIAAHVREHGKAHRRVQTAGI